MNRTALRFSVVAAFFLMSSLYVGSRELSLIQFSQASKAHQFEILANDGPDSGFSTLADRIVLDACRDALSAIFGRLQPSTLRSKVAKNCYEISDRISYAQPVASYAYFISALAQFEMKDFQSFNKNYISSQKTGANEMWLARFRFALSKRGVSHMSFATQSSYDADISVLIQSQSGLHLIAEYYVQTPDLREGIAILVEKLPEADQRRFLSAVDAELRALKGKS